MRTQLRESLAERVPLQGALNVVECTVAQVMRDCQLQGLNVYLPCWPLVVTFLPFLRPPRCPQHLSPRLNPNQHSTHPTRHGSQAVHSLVACLVPFTPAQVLEFVIYSHVVSGAAANVPPLRLGPLVDPTALPPIQISNDDDPDEALVQERAAEAVQNAGRAAVLQVLAAGLRRG